MLDIHPPEHTPHTWRDFFIHIATIVVGLVIAIGLEQSVEYIHHRHQAGEANNALHQELAMNAKLFALETRFFQERTPRYAANLSMLLALRANPHTSPLQPQRFDWDEHAIPFENASWTTVQRDAVVEFLPKAQVEESDELYKRLDQIRAFELAERSQSEEAGGFFARYANTAHPTSAELDKLIDLASSLLVAHARLGMELRRASGRFPQLTPAPDVESLDRILGRDMGPGMSAEDKSVTDQFFAITGRAAPAAITSDH